MTNPTITKTGESFDTWNEVEEPDRREAPPQPRLRVLYHSELERIGATTLPGIPLTDGAWQVVGRNEPRFLKPEGRSRPLEDPTVSRKQLRVRWRPSRGVFEVEPVPSAKRRVGWISLEPDGETRDIATRCELPPGSVIAIENRVILALELSHRYTPPDQPRLGLVGESDVMWALRRAIHDIAVAPGPVLILGPTGAGKELVAQAIHQESSRGPERFVVANCAALPEHLVESLLFGHKKGAFTGATQDRDGLFRAADTGSLFLDEIGELPVGVQPKLLRALQDGQVQPIGRHATVRTDVRVLAATNRDPAERIRTGHLREDLYHRVACHVVEVPRLTARRLDIPELFVHFLTGEADDVHRHLWRHRSIPAAFFIELMRYDWSGNVRELINVTRRTLRANTREPFTAPHLRRHEPEPEPHTPPPFPVSEVHAARDRAERARARDERDEPRDPRDEHDPARDAALQAACDTLALHPSTFEKLLGEALPELWLEHSPDDPTHAIAEWLDRHAAAALRQLLAQNGYRQRPVTQILGVSPTTLIKLMQHFGIPRATDLAPDTLAAALDDADGDIPAAAADLEISEQALKRRLAILERSS